MVRLGRSWALTGACNCCCGKEYVSLMNLLQGSGNNDVDEGIGVPY